MSNLPPADKLPSPELSYFLGQLKAQSDSLWDVAEENGNVQDLLDMIDELLRHFGLERP